MMLGRPANAAEVYMQRMVFRVYIWAADIIIYYNYCHIVAAEVYSSCGTDDG